MTERHQQMTDLSALADYFRTVPPPATVSNKLHELMIRFADPESDAEHGRLSEEEYQQMLILLNEEPGGMSYLRLLCETEAEGPPTPLTAAERQGWMSAIQAAAEAGPPVRLPDFSVRLSRGSLSYVQPGSRLMIRQSYDLARGSEFVTSLQHSQRLKNCEVCVTIEVESAVTFSLRVELTYLNPEYNHEELSLQVMQQSGDSVGVEPFKDREAEFAGLSTGFYQAVVVAGAVPIDEFSAEFTETAEDSENSL